MEEIQKIWIKYENNEIETRIIKMNISSSLEDLRKKIQLQEIYEFKLINKKAQIQRKDEQVFKIKDIMVDGKNVIVGKVKVFKGDLKGENNNNKKIKYQIEGKYQECQVENLKMNLQDFRQQISLSENFVFWLDGEIGQDSEEEFILEEILQNNEILEFQVKNKQEQKSLNQSQFNEKNQNSLILKQSKQLGFGIDQQNETNNGEKKKIKIIYFDENQQEQGCIGVTKVYEYLKLDELRPFINKVGNLQKEWVYQMAGFQNIGEANEKNFSLNEILKEDKYLIINFKKDEEGNQSKQDCQIDNKKKQKFINRVFVNEIAKNLPSEVKAVFIEQQNGLSIYQYPIIDLCPQKRSRSKIIILMGQTGSGKSTFIDSLVNYLLGVSLQDKFRYKIVQPNKILQNKQIQEEDQSQSQTQEVREYFIRDHGEGSSYVIVDTPGFLDTQKNDKQIEFDIKGFINKNLEKVHSIGMVIQSSLVRFSQSQTYVFNKILDIFGSDVQKVLNILFTFNDGQPPQGIQPIDFEKIPYRDWYCFNNSAIFDGNIEDEFVKNYWGLGMSSIKEYLNEIKKEECVDLEKTKKVISQRDEQEQLVDSLKQSLKKSIENLKQLREQIIFVEKCEKGMEQNKNFKVLSYEKDFEIVGQLKNSNNYQFYCKNCFSTCGQEQQNYNYYYQRDEYYDIQSYNYNQGQICCRFCQCQISQHFKSNKKLKQIQKKVFHVLNDKQWLYYQSKNELNIKQAVIQELKKKIETKINSMVEIIQKIEELLSSLSKISLNIKNISPKHFIQEFIEQEKEEKYPEYEERIQLWEKLLFYLDAFQFKVSQDSSKLKNLLIEQWKQHYENIKQNKQNEITSCSIY